MHDTLAGRRFYGQQLRTAGLAEIVMEAAGPVPAGQDGQRRVQIGACQHRARDKVARDPRRLIVGPDMIDGLHQACVVDGKSVPRQQARRIETREADTMAGTHPDEKTLPVQLRLIVFVVGDNGGLPSPCRNHDGGAAGDVGGTLIPTAGEIATTIPQKNIVEVGPGTIGDPFYFAQDLRIDLSGRRQKGCQPIASGPIAFERLETLHVHHRIADRTGCRLPEAATNLVGVACDYYAFNGHNTG